MVIDIRTDGIRTLTFTDEYALLALKSLKPHLIHKRTINTITTYDIDDDYKIPINGGLMSMWIWKKNTTVTVELCTK